MKKLWQLILVSTLGLTVCLAQDVVSIVHGTVKKVVDQIGCCEVGGWDGEGV